MLTDGGALMSVDTLSARLVEEGDELTNIEWEVVEFLGRFLLEEDRFPFTREIADAFEWQSQTSAVQVLHSLERKGWVEKRENEGRRTWFRFTRLD